MTFALRPIAATALRMRPGQTVRIRKLSEEAVCSVTAFSFFDLAETLSNARTFAEEQSIRVRKGSRLWSNRGKPLVEIVDGAAESLNFLLAPFRRCSDETPASVRQPRPGWFRSIGRALAPYGAASHGCEATFNLFLPLVIRPSGAIAVTKPSASPRPVRLKALEHLVVGFIIGTAGERAAPQALGEISIELDEQI